MFNLGQYMEMTAPGSGVAEGLAVNDVREMEELSSQDLYETFDVHETETIFYKGIMPSEKVLDFPVDCNTLTGSVNL